MATDRDRAPGTVQSDGSLAELLSEFWSDEQCAWHLDFDKPWGVRDESENWWRLDLEWTQEYGNAHGADLATFTWQFFGASPDECITEAVQWCRDLIPFKRCPACDGEGKYGSPSDPTTCEECDGTGLMSAHGQQGPG